MSGPFFPFNLLLLSSILQALLKAMVSLSLGKQHHATSELAKTVKTEKDVERCRFKMTQARPAATAAQDAFQNAKSQFMARYKSSEVAREKEVRSKNVPVDSGRQHHATHRLSPRQAHQFRELQYSSGMLKRESPLAESSKIGSASPELSQEHARLSSVQAARKPQLVRIPSCTIPEHETAEIMDVDDTVSPTSSKRQSFQSDITVVSTSSDATLVNNASDPRILKRYKERVDYADESTWRTASVIMRAYAKQHPIPSRNENWAVLPEARRPKGGALRRSSAQRIPNYMRRASSMKRQSSSNAN